MRIGKRIVVGTACAALLLIAASAASRRSNDRRDRPGETTELFLRGIDSLDASLVTLHVALAGAQRFQAITAFRTARQFYKRIELFLAYFNPVESAGINGPRVDADDDDPNPPPKSTPIGFQIIEAALFDSSVTLAAAADETQRMRGVLSSLRTIARGNTVTPPVTVDAARLELARITTIGLSGTDTDLSGDAVLEAASALEGIRDALVSVTSDSAIIRQVAKEFDHAALLMKAESDFATFERLRFIAGPMRRLASVIGAVRTVTGDPPPAARRFWKAGAATPFDAGAFAADAFEPAHGRTSAALIGIGERMFHDVRLSGPKTRSCASCHRPERAFADGKRRAEMIGGGASTLRNTPTLINVALQPTFFADARSLSLENQIGIVLESPYEMGSSAEQVASMLERDSSYRTAFRAARAARTDSAITALEVRQALAAYLRTLVAMTARFDRAVRGDSAAMTPDERRGFDVFMGKAKCGTCHFAPLFSGLAPPLYRVSETEIIGVPAEHDLRSPTLDGDIGRAHVEDTPLNRFAFKVPSLRNVALTAPYMHNGVFSTLEEVVEFYDRGGGAGLGLDIPYQSLPAAPLRLTPNEKRSLVAFMHTLTDTALRRSPP